MTVQVAWDAIEAAVRKLGWRQADGDAVPQKGQYRIALRGADPGDRRQGGIGTGKTRMVWHVDIELVYPTGDPGRDRQVAIDLAALIGKIDQSGVLGISLDGIDVSRDVSKGTTTATSRWTFFGEA
jgi:hypothetical protein